jgi:hypothetical protein
MQFSMARKFRLLPLRRYSVEHSKTYNFDTPWLEKTKEHRLGANQHPNCSPPLYTTALHLHVKWRIFKIHMLLFAKFH